MLIKKFWKDYLIGHVKYWTKDLDFETKPLYRSCAGSNFYGTDIEIWAGFGPVGSTDYEQLLWAFFFMYSWAKEI